MRQGGKIITPPPPQPTTRSQASLFSFSHNTRAPTSCISVTQPSSCKKVVLIKFFFFPPHSPPPSSFFLSGTSPGNFRGKGVFMPVCVCVCAAAADGAREVQSTACGAGEAGGLLPGVRCTVLPPPLSPPLPWRPRSPEPGKPRRRARSSGSGTSTEARAAGALRPQSPRRGGGEPGLGWQGRACECLRVKARAARCSALTPLAPAQVAAAPESPVCSPRHARSSHEHQRSQGVSGPERNPSAFRGRGLGLAETDGEIGARHPQGSG